MRAPYCFSVDNRNSWHWSPRSSDSGAAAQLGHIPSRFPEAGRVVRSHCGTVKLSKLWAYTDFSINAEMILFRKQGNHCVILVFSNARNRHVFVDLASVPVLPYATAKQL